LDGPGGSIFDENAAGLSGQARLIFVGAGVRLIGLQVVDQVTGLIGFADAIIDVQ
jgi:hypothetical protein